MDAPLGCAVQTALPPVTPFTTAETSFKFLCAVVPQSGTLTAKGRLITPARPRACLWSRPPIKRAACSRSRASGCAILPRVQVPSECYRAGAEEPAPSAGAGLAVAHPYERLVAGEILAQEIWNGTDDLGVLLSLITGDLPAPPLARFCGIAPVRRRRTGSHGNGTAIDGTVQTTLPAGTAFAPVDLKVCFLRPVSPDGRDLLARGTVIHRGRSIAIAISEVFNADGKKAAVATGSTVILPGRPATVTTELTLPQLDESEDDEERR